MTTPPSPLAGGSAAEKATATLAAMPESWLALQLAAIGTLAALQVTFKAVHVIGGHDYVYGLGPLFDMEGEANIPAYYSMLIVLFNAALLAAIGVAYRQRQLMNSGYWLFLAAIFLFLAYDEAFSLHERIGDAVRAAVDGKLGPGLDWLLPGLGFAAIVAAVTVRFLFQLDPRTRVLMIASGAIFVAGAVGVEALGGLRLRVVPSSRASPDALYFALVTIEETLEMLGMALFNYALLDHLRATFGQLTFDLAARR